TIHNGDFISKIKHLAVADCTGHGVPGALMSVICSNALNETLVQNKIYETDQVLNEARKIVKRSLKTRKFQERKDGMDISFVTINQETNELWYSGANNPAWVLHNGEIIELIPDKQPIGVYEVEKDFTKKYLKLHKGDIVYLFSDGFADQFGGPKGKKFKYKQMEDLFKSISSLSMSEQKEKIQKAFEEWRGDLEQIDDVTVVGIKV
ncbi:MAG: PP2C family protein-serine/threonine phosphatase, partial [Bacteroidota bacterium]